MDFKAKIISVIKNDADCDWGAIVEHRNKMQCYKFNSAVVRALRRNGIEALLVGAHYPKETSNCANYYALARDQDSGKVVIIDAWVNSLFDGMKEPFIGSLDEAKKFMATMSSQNWDSNWNLDHIVISKLNPDIPSGEQARKEFRKKWGEFGQGLVFDQPQAIPSNMDFLGKEPKPFAPSGHTLTLAEMNRYAMSRPGMNTNYFGFPHTEPTAQTFSEAIVDVNTANSEFTAQTSPKKGWREWLGLGRLSASPNATERS